MKIKYLGTAAAEAIPALFCNCKICQNARIKQGKEIRGRSNVMINDVMIDFSPDAFFYSIRYHLNYANLKYLVITHSHLDHLAAGELIMRFPEMYSAHLSHDLHIYGNVTSQKILKKASLFDVGTASIKGMHFHPIHYGDSFQCEDLHFTALPANHKKDEEAMIYLIQPNNKTILYAHDTGGFEKEVFDYLKEEHVSLDLVSLDCTFGKAMELEGHMGIQGVLKTIAELKPYSHEKTQFVISHFSHFGNATHEDLETLVKPYNITVAFDGLEIEI